MRLIIIVKNKSMKKRYSKPTITKKGNLKTLVANLKLVKFMAKGGNPEDELFDLNSNG